MEKQPELIPLNDGVLLKEVEKEETFNGSRIVIPDLGQERGFVCKVVATGPGRFTEYGHFLHVDVQEGDTVLIPKIGASRVEFEGEEYLLIPSREILCIIKK